MTQRGTRSGCNMLDVRDIIARFEELRDERDTLESNITSTGEDAAACDTDTPLEDYEKFTEAADEALAALETWEDQGEYDSLKSLLEDLAGNGGDEQWDGTWYPLTLIRDSHFEDYARELAEDIGAISREDSWPHNFIDWERAAYALQMDYSRVAYDGETYWYR